MEARRDAMLKKLASRHEQRVLQKSQKSNKELAKIDIAATEKAFLQSDPSSLDMKTPVRNKTKPITQSYSPIVSFDDKADQQIIALSSWCNTIMNVDNTEDFDLGSTKIEASRKIQEMLKSKNSEQVSEGPSRTGHFLKIFTQNNPDVVFKKCRAILQDSDIDRSISSMISKKVITVRSDCAVHSDISLQTSLLRIFLSFHPAWLKIAIEATFNTRITVNSRLVNFLGKFIVTNVFSSPHILKMKKYALGSSGIPLITPAGKEALHSHFLSVVMKILYVIENARLQKVLPNLQRVFSRSSLFKCLEDVFAELSKQVLSGSSLPLKKAFAKIGFIASYKQTFIDDYDYHAKSFKDFANGIILAKLVEIVGMREPGSLLTRLRDPAGDRIRKLKNVEIVLAEMESLGIATEGVTPTKIVGGNKEAILTVLWSIIGVRVSEEHKKKPTRRRSIKFNDFSDTTDGVESKALKFCQKVGNDLGVIVGDIEDVRDGKLLEKAWNIYNSNAMVVSFYPGSTLWEKILSLAEIEMGIAKGLDQHLSLFVKIFFERLFEIVECNSHAMVIQRAWRNYIDRKKQPKLAEIVDLARKNLCTPEPLKTFEIEPSSACRFSTSTFNNLTFTINGAHEPTNTTEFSESTFKMPTTPSQRMIVSKETKLFEQVIEENDENDENDDNDFDSSIADEMFRRLDGLSNDEDQMEDADKESEKVEYRKTFVKHRVFDVTEDDEYMEWSGNDNGMAVKECNKSDQEDIDDEAHDSHERFSNLKIDDEHESYQYCEGKQFENSSNGMEYYHTTHLDESSEMVQNDEINCSALDVQHDFDGHAENHYSKEFPQNSLKVEEDELDHDGNNSSNTKADALSNEVNIRDDGTNVSHVYDSSEQLNGQCGSMKRDNKVVTNQNSHRDSEDDFLLREARGVHNNYVELPGESGNDRIELEKSFDNLPSHSFSMTKESLKQQSTPELRKIYKSLKKISEKQNQVALKLLRFSDLQSDTNSQYDELTADMARIESYNEKNSSDRNDAGCDGSFEEAENMEDTQYNDFYNQIIRQYEETLAKSNDNEETRKRENAAVVIQKNFRGFLARRNMMEAIRTMQAKVIEYNKDVNEQLDQYNVETRMSNGSEIKSAEMRLKEYTVNGLDNASLSVVNLAAHAIYRIISLLPEFVESFVNKYNGMERICDIVKVADRGFSYTRIIAVLINILEKVIVLTPLDQTKTKISKTLPHLTPKLQHLLLVNAGKQPDLFVKICRILSSIIRNWNDLKMDKISFYVKKSRMQIKDKRSANSLSELEIISTSLQSRQ